MNLDSIPLWFTFLIAIIFGGLAIGIITVIIREIAKPNGGTTDNAKLYRQPIMTETESKFYDFLSDTIGNKYLIETKKPLTIIFKRHGNLSRELWTMHSHGHVDFLIVEQKTKNPILGIELDDWTHNRPKQQDADNRKDELFRRGELKLLRFKVAKWGEQEKIIILNNLPTNI